ncbi:MAG: capsule biosynthesis protein, partial [Paracoccaceae bacterium]
EALIEVDLLAETTQAGDPRMEQALRRVRVTEDRITEERRKLGLGDSGEQGQVYADLVGEYERLRVEQDFAQQTYTASLASYDTAVGEAQRKSRYLAAHVLPTTAEKSEYPQRLTLFGLIALFSFAIWGILVLVAFSLKDRR